MTVRIAAAAYPITRPGNWDEYTANLRDWVRQGAETGAQLLIFPEYAALELVALLPAELHHDILGMRPALTPFVGRVVDLHRSLALEFGIAIVAGSLPVAAAGGFVNRAYVFGPGGAVGHQDKLMMTRFEAEEWSVQPGNGEVTLFTLGDLKFGVVICYDSEFPQLSRRLAEAGANLLVVPSFTETRRGYSRVRIGSMARALENGLYTAQAPLLADAPWSYALETAVGAASVYAPADVGLPEDGVVAELGWNESGWLTADLNLAALTQVRGAGHVLNFRDRVAAQERPRPPQTLSLGQLQ